MNDIVRGPLRQTTYDAIKVLIVTGQLAPGRRVTEHELVDLLQVSRTPIREALNRLQCDGLVNERPKTGFAVADFDIAMLLDAFNVRAELDDYATRLAVARITDDEIARLRGLVVDAEYLAQTDTSPKSRLQEMELGTDLHRSIATLSGNALLANMLHGLLDKCQVFVWMEMTQLNDWQAAREDHALIAEAIAARDAKTACREARRHILESRDLIHGLLQQRQSLRDIYTAQGT